MKKKKKASVEEKLLYDIVKYGTPIVFKDGVYRAKDKKEAEILSAFIKHKK